VERLKAARVRVRRVRAPRTEETTPVLAKLARDDCNQPRLRLRVPTTETAERLAQAAFVARDQPDRNTKLWGNGTPPENRRPSRGFPIHVYALNSGIIGTLLHYRKETHLVLSPRTRRKIERFFKSLRESATSEDEQPRPKLCPACRTLVGAGATRCHNCGASMRFSMAAANQSLARYLPQTSPVTYTILTVSCLIFLATFIATLREVGFQGDSGGFSGIFNLGAISEKVLIISGSSLPLPYDLAEPWRFVTAVFLHGSILHILFNMWFLMDVGPQIEELYGSARYFFIYVVTGICGYVVSSAAGHLSIGGSGALMGLVGVLLALTMGRQSAGMQMLRTRLIYFIIYIAVLGFLMRTVDNWAHGGGLVTGFIIGKLMSDRQPSTPEQRRLASVLGWGAALVVIASFAMVLLKLTGGSI
jgi:rhomboid protease GluP